MLEVSTVEFSGPMDLLLDLIQKSKVDLYAIEISSITEEYLQAMQTMDIPMEELSDFIRMASILVQMKAKMLSDDFEEEEEVPDREAFLERLLEYRLYKTLAGELRPLEEAGERYFYKLPEDLSPYAQEDPPLLSGEAKLLFSALEGLVQRRSRKSSPGFSAGEILAADPYPESRIARRIRQKMANGLLFSFFDLFDPADQEKKNIISTFLFLLELSRRQALSLEQKGRTIAIHLRSRDRLFSLLDTMEKGEGEEDPGEAAEKKPGEVPARDQALDFSKRRAR